MNQNTAFYYFRLWRDSDKKVIGQQLTLGEYQTCLRLGMGLFSFPGRRATVCTLVQDTTIGRTGCLDFVVAFMAGKMEEVNVDLNTLTVKRARIIPPP